MDPKQQIAQEVLTKLAALLTVLREPGYQLKLRSLEVSEYPYSNRTATSLKIDLGQEEELYLSLTLRRAGGATPKVETSAVLAENNPSAVAKCRQCNFAAVKDPGEMCRECIIEYGGGL